MSSERVERIRLLFLQAAELSPEERDTWLNLQCGADTALADEVRALLSGGGLGEDPLEDGLPIHRLRDTHRVGRPELPGYKIVREVGAGGQAIVYEAIQDSTSHRVAIKMLRWGHASTASERERFDREISVLSRLNHPHVLTIFNRGKTADGTVFLVTEFVDGLPIDEFVKFRGNSMDANDALELFVKVATAVDVAHRAGVVHRDLKPSNIIVDQHGEPRVLDFGLAKPTFGKTNAITQEQALTETGQFLGSLPWASPEQAKGEVVDARSDIYSLGILLFQLVTGGKFPYNVSGNMPKVLGEIINTKPTPPSQFVMTRGKSRPQPSRLNRSMVQSWTRLCSRLLPNRRTEDTDPHLTLFLTSENSWQKNGLATSLNPSTQFTLARFAIAS